MDIRKRAVALLYIRGKTKLPMVVAKGQGALAHQMIEAAEEEGVPIMQDIPLAHSLYDDVGLEQYIPRNLFRAVSEVLHWVEEVKAEEGKSDLHDPLPENPPTVEEWKV